eukprot:m.29812 g.29812  ORF g.29812 m.29812 type:complete len:264 (+) comp12111_c0_seq1:74-865(+)
MTAVVRLSASLLVAARATTAPRSNYRILFLQRSHKSSAFAKAHVFPGGVWDPTLDSCGGWKSLLAHTAEPPLPADQVPEQWQQFQTTDPSSSESCVDLVTSMKLTALRETFEESGIFAWPEQPYTAQQLHNFRHRIHGDGAVLQEMIRGTLSATQPKATLGHLHPIVRYVTPTDQIKRFDSFFYLTCLDSWPEDVQEDGTETTRVHWLAPEEALEAFNKRNVYLWPPQVIRCVFRHILAHSKKFFSLVLSVVFDARALTTPRI